jgi:hypothetical protein
MPRDFAGQLVVFEIAEGNSQHAGLTVSDVDPARLSEGSRPRRPSVAGANEQLHLLVASVELDLSAQNARGGARGLGSGNRALDDGDVGPAIRGGQRYAASHDTGPDDRNSHPSYVPKAPLKIKS